MAKGNLKPITIKGTKYNSHKAAADALKIPYQTFMVRLWKGLRLDKPVRKHAPWGSSKLPQ